VDLLAHFDADERISAVYPDTRREELSLLVRHVDLVGTYSSVIYSRLSADTVEAAITEQVAYFNSLGHDFEWKVFAHDQPPDLAERLAGRGFELDETEAILVLDLQQTSYPEPTAPSRVRRLTRTDELRDVATIKQRADVVDIHAQVKRLTYEMEHTPDGISVYVAYFDDAPAACGWIRFPTSSAFASLWGGSTVPELRNRGLYQDVLNARVQAARTRGFHYLTVDARHMSRPILEKQGFQVLTFATACTWSHVALKEA
jgi:GNAT superfamily N-acetyltransferase